MKTNDDKSKVNVVQNFEDENLYLATAKEVVKSKWIMDLTTTNVISLGEITYVYFFKLKIQDVSSAGM